MIGNPLQPKPSVLAKLGSIVVHVEEMQSADGHTFDHIALESLMRDPEVKGWMKEMRQLSMVPEKRR